MTVRATTAAGARRARASRGPAVRRSRTLVAAPLWILAILAAAFFLRETRDMFVPVALALLASYAVYPVVAWIDKLGSPRPLSAALVVGCLLGACGLMGWSLRDDFAEGVRQLPQQIRDIRAELQATTEGSILARLQTAARELQAPETTPAGRGRGGATGGTGRPASPPGAQDAGTNAPLAHYLWQGSFSAITIAGQIAVFVFLLYFLLIGADRWRERLVTLSGSVLSSRRTGAEVISEITSQVQRFLLVRVATSAVVGVATWAALLAFGAPAPAFWAAAAALLNWIPYFGPIIVSSGLAVVGFVAGGLALAGKLAISALVITTLEGWLITPPLLGRAAQMNTLAILISLLFWSWVWGVWGTILAVPLMMMVKAVADHVEPLHWLSLLLAEDPRRPTS